MTVVLVFVLQPPAGLQSPFFHSRLHHYHHHHRHHHHANHHDSQQQQQLIHGRHSSPMHEAFPPPRLFAGTSTHSAVMPPTAPSLLVGLRHPVTFEHQLKALYRRSFDRQPLSSQPDVMSESSNRGIRSPVGHGDGLQSEPTAYDQLLMQATAPSQPAPPSESACGYDGLAVISFHCKYKLSLTDAVCKVTGLKVKVRQRRP